MYLFYFKPIYIRVYSEKRETAKAVVRNELYRVGGGMPRSRGDFLGAPMSKTSIFCRGVPATKHEEGPFWKCSWQAHLRTKMRNKNKHVAHGSKGNTRRQQKNKHE
jgi:hypothetical protein